MASYKDLYAAFSKRYVSELSKQRIQDNCNACWNDLKKQFSGVDLDGAVDKKILQLKAETKSTQSSLLSFFAQVRKNFFSF